MPEAEIYRAYNFVLDIQGVQSGYFSDVSGLSVSVETIEYREGGVPLPFANCPVGSNTAM